MPVKGIIAVGLIAVVVAVVCFDDLATYLVQWLEKMDEE